MRMHLGKRLNGKCVISESLKCVINVEFVVDTLRLICPNLTIHAALRLRN